MPVDAATLKQVVPKLKGTLARSMSPWEQELVVEKLYQFAPEWVKQAAGQTSDSEMNWPPRHWHQIAKRVAAAARAGVQKAEE